MTKGAHARPAGGLPVSSARAVINSNFQLQMSHCSENDGELSVPSTYGSEVQESQAQQDCRKRPRQLQSQGNSWALRAQITVDQLHAESDGLTGGSEGDVEYEERTAKINVHLQSLFGAQFQILFGKLPEIVSYFVIFCNLINILDVGRLGTDSNGAAEIKIEFQGYLQLRTPRAVTRLQDLLKPFAPALSGYWERCVGGLFGHDGYTECLRPESACFKLHDTGEFRNNNKAKLQAKTRRLANPVFLERGTSAMICSFLISGPESD
jgi:hypothetical protein